MTRPGVTLRVWGQVHEPLAWDGDALRDLPRSEIVAPAASGSATERFGGVAVRQILARIRLRDDASFVMVHGSGDRRCGFSLTAFAAPGLLLADTCDGKPLSDERGGPLRLIAPGAPPGAPVDGVTGIELLNKPWPDSPSLA